MSKKQYTMSDTKPWAGKLGVIVGEDGLVEKLLHQRIMKNWHIKEQELTYRGRVFFNAVGILVRDPGFKLGREIKDALKEGKRLYAVVVRR